MAHQENFLKHQDQSPYVANEGNVGELGQPAAAAQEHQRVPVHHEREDLPRDQTQGVQQYHDQALGEQQVTSGDRGLHFGGGGKYDKQGTNHPLEATHDTNIGHGHETFFSAGEGTATPVGTPVGGPDQHQKKGVGEKMKGTMKGVKEAVTGHKHHGNQEQYSGAEAPSAASGGTKPGVVDKMKDVLTGQKPGQGTATGYATAGSVVPGEDDYIGKTRPNDFAGIDRPLEPAGGPKKSDAGTGYPAHEGGWPSPAPPPGMFKPGATGNATFPPHKSHAFNSDTTESPTYSQARPEKAHLKEEYGKTPRKDEAAPVMSSTPAEENVRHDVPDEHHTTGAEYVDDHGKVQQEGPRDDNVKKEGMMSKMMDKLHLGGKTSSTA